MKTTFTNPFVTEESSKSHRLLTDYDQKDFLNILFTFEGGAITIDKEGNLCIYDCEIESN